MKRMPESVRIPAAGANAVVVTCATLLCVACATNVVPLSATERTAHVVKVKRVIVEDFTIRNRTGDAGNWVYKSGWFPIPTKWTAPPFTDVLIAELRQSFKGSNANEPTLDLAVLDAGLYMDKSAADDVAFVGIAMAFRERKYLCDATINFRLGDRSEKVTFEAQEVRNRSYSDLDQEDAGRMVSECKSKLIARVYERVRTFIGES